MIKVLILATTNRQGYVNEFHRRFIGKFRYRISLRSTCMLWENMKIDIVEDVEHARGRSADIAINFDQYGTDIFTQGSCINIKEKRATTYFDLLDAINDDGTFNWETYLTQEEDDWLAEL